MMSFSCHSVRVSNTISIFPPPLNLELPNRASHFPMKENSSLKMQKLTTLTECDAAAKPSTARKLGERWREYQGSLDWEGLLDPLDDELRLEILRYGHFVEAAYLAFDFDPLSPSYATCRFSSGDETMSTVNGYRVTKHLHATCGVRAPRWIEKLPGRISVRSSWIGYVAVCQDREEIARLGRRDVVIALRGTATCLEWLENLRTGLTGLSSHVCSESCGPMVESGFFSLYTSRSETCLSLQETIKEEIARIVRLYGDEPISLTITGHSLGAALAILSAYDLTTTFADGLTVTVFSFGGPRVGNKDLRRELDKSGIKILRIVNSDDLVTKVPGFVDDDDDDVSDVASLPRWIRKRVGGTLGYANVGQELKLSSRKSPYLNKGNLMTCHDLKTYLNLVNDFVSSTCPFRAATTEMLTTRFIS